MTSFATHRLRVHDVSLAPVQRFCGFRTCVAEFAPYGVRATYHHLVHSARIPADLEEDPDALVRAVEELHAAREIWRAAHATWVVARCAQKAAGVRIPDPPEPTRRLWCPDPEFHPVEPLTVTMPHILRAPPGEWASCPVCDVDRGTTRYHAGYGVHRLCAGCGVSLGHRPTGPQDDVPAARAAVAARWRLVWRRTAPPWRGH
ncbi:hypothetical protein [Streptomyces sp. NPDC056544]|uniref:hypothetical protein n=1 Tax=unclassified Streptomyces TaxID=2593676 RepID=UPI003683FAB6